MNLYPYVVEPNGTLPWTGPAEFASVSPCMDAILQSDGGFESFSARFVHNDPPTPAKWIEILIHEGNRYGGPHEAGYLLGRARLPASAAAGPKAHAHGHDYHFAYSEDIAGSKLESIGDYGDVIRHHNETGWYADTHQFEVLAGHVYAYGRRYEQGCCGWDWYGEYHGYIAAVHSNDTDIVLLVAERHADDESAARTAHAFAERLAETERRHDFYFHEALTSRLALVQANDRRRSALDLVREHGGLDQVPAATRALIDREWAQSADERKRTFSRIEEHRPGPWATPDDREHWQNGWRMA